MVNEVQENEQQPDPDAIVFTEIIERHARKNDGNREITANPVDVVRNRVFVAPEEIREQHHAAIGRNRCNRRAHIAVAWDQ